MKDKDVKINNSFENFKFRVNGILIHNNKILLVKIHKNKFYCLPGGHVKLGEDTRNAVIREFKEETGYNVKINKLISVTENFFVRENGEKTHELSFYYLLNIENEKDLNYNEYKTMDENIELQLKWFSIEELKNIDFRPKELREKIVDRNTDFEHLIIK